MADIDLGEALKMFQSGAKELMLSRSIANANDTVQQIKSSEMNEQQQRAALQNVSNQLTTHMAQMGTPATTMSAVAGAIGPKQYANSDAAALDGYLNGDKNAIQAAQGVKDMDFRLQDKLALAAAKRDPFAQMMKQKMLDESISKTNNKLFTGFQNDLDVTKASSRTAFGLTGSSLKKSSQIEALMGDPKNWNNMNGADATLVAEGLSNLVKGGVATESELKALIPHTGAMNAATIKQYLTNKPEPAQMQAFMQKYNDIMEREKSANQVQAQDAILNRATGNLKLHERDPEQFKKTIASNLTQSGMPTDPSDVQVTPKGVTTTQMTELNAKADRASKGLKQAYAALKSSNPQDKLDAARAFKALGVDPSMNPESALKHLKLKVRAGLL